MAGLEHEQLDQLIDRRSTHSTKWEKYAGRDILPFWIADMDFAVPDFILDALRITSRPSNHWLHKPPTTLTEASKDGLTITLIGLCQRNGLSGYPVWYQA